MRVVAVCAALGLAACSIDRQSGGPQLYLPVLVDRPTFAGGAFKETILYNFELKAKNESPLFPDSSLLLGGDNALYGATATYAGGHATPYGSVFEFRLQTSLHVLHRFHGGRRGAYPSRIVSDSVGTLFGTTFSGGDMKCLHDLGCGTAFKMSPGASSYTTSVIHRFRGGSDGIFPSAVTIGDGGVLYGETSYGGTSGCGGFGCGIIFGLAPTGERYRETILYRFTGGRDGSTPMGGVILDSNGDLFGVTLSGGRRCSEAKTGCGTVYEAVRRGSVYQHAVLYRFSGVARNDAAFPNSLIRGSDGRLYGTARGGRSECSKGCGTIFELIPAGSAYKERVLRRFEPARGKVQRGLSTLLLRDGQLYGTTAVGGSCISYYFPHGCGTAFSLNPRNGLTRLIHDFKGPPEDGATPAGGFISARGGLLYAATASGGNGECSYFTGCGTIYQLGP